MAGLFNDIYKGKKVLVTGHTGFKGSWLCLWLTQLGAEVIGYSVNTPTKPDHFSLLNLPITSVMGDITDLQHFQETVTTYKPDIIFHLAAQALVRDSYQSPVATFATNVMGTVNVLEACRQAGVQAIVNVTSDKCYQNLEQEEAYVETDPMGGYDPYSASKGCAELVGNAYRNSFFNVEKYGDTHHTLLADARAGNVIGGGDWAKDRLIPDIMRATAHKETVTIRSPRSTRPWQHVLEPLSGYLNLGWKLLEGEKEFADNWNFGPLDEAAITVKEVTEHTQKYWEAIQYEIQENQAIVHEAHLLQVDSTKARVQLRWKSIWNSEATFAKTTSWYKAYYEAGQVQSTQDLQDYINDAKQAGVEWAL